MKVSLLTITLISSVLVSAKAQIQFGVKAGFNNSSARPVQKPNSLYYQSIYAWQAGVFAGKKVSKNFSLQSSLLLSQKGSNENFIFLMLPNYQGTDLTYRINYLELDLQPVYHLPMTGKIKINISAGPFIGVGISGTLKGVESDVFIERTVEEKIKFSNSDDYSNYGWEVKPLNAGFNAAARFQYKRFFIYTGWSQAFTRRFSNNDLYNWRNTAFSAGLGVFIK